MNRLKQAGFTLIELLVVIAIIAIMASIGLVSFTNVQQKARDSKRRSDITEIQKSFEQYYADNNTYSATQAVMATSLPGSTLPKDPKTAADYTYSAMSVSTYCVCATMEVAGSGNSGAACAFGAAVKTSFCVAQSQ